MAAARSCAPQAGQVAEFACETVNVPAVMSPWELNSHFGLLFADAVPHPNLEQVRADARSASRATWQGLWFRYGDAPEGHDELPSALLQHFVEEIACRWPDRCVLKNELQLVQRAADHGRPSAPCRPTARRRRSRSAAARRTATTR